MNIASLDNGELERLHYYLLTITYYPNRAIGVTIHLDLLCRVYLTSISVVIYFMQVALNMKIGTKK